MKNIFIFMAAFALSMALANCGAHSHDHDHSHDAHSHDGHDHAAEPQVLTAYSNSFELFAEVADMHVGDEGFVLAHVTRLCDFKPLDSAEVTFTLTVGGTSAKSVAKQQAPGIYRCDITPAKDGVGYLICKIASQDVAEEVMFPISVFKAGQHNHSHAGEASHANGSNMVTFPKEQS